MRLTRAALAGGIGVLILFIMDQVIHAKPESESVIAMLALFAMFFAFFGIPCPPHFKRWLIPVRSATGRKPNN